jgi:hypothetical protein
MTTTALQETNDDLARRNGELRQMLDTMAKEFAELCEMDQRDMRNFDAVYKESFRKANGAITDYRIWLAGSAP